jgi:hypothetical protein
MRILKLALALFLVIQLITPLSARALEGININLLMQEAQKRGDKPGEVDLVQWFPEETWRLSLAQNPSITPEQAEATLSVFRPYVIIAVVEGKLEATGSITYKSEAEIRARLRILDTSGNEYYPLAEDGINVTTKSLLAGMKPLFASTMGAMGQNMHFFAFVAKGKDGAEIADPKKEGTFSVKLGEKELKWKLPLSSLVPEKACPTCKQKLNGTYKYCPWDGTPLS